MERQEGINEITESYESQFRSTPAALSDLRVVDLSNDIAGAFCSKLFADFGADVIKVEPPSGDPTRSLGPFPDDDANPEAGGMFIFLNTNKRAITLNLEPERGQNLAADLMAKADVIVESFAPGEMDPMGMGYDTIQKANPAAIIVSTTSGVWNRSEPSASRRYREA